MNFRAIGECERVLSGDEVAAREFRDRYYPLVLGVVMRRCGDGRSRAEAEDIAEGVIADCFGASGKAPLLELYSGRAPLDRGSEKSRALRSSSLRRSFVKRLPRPLRPCARGE